MSDDRVDVELFQKIFSSVFANKEQAQQALNALERELDKDLLVKDLFYLPMMLKHEDLLLSERAWVDWTLYELQNSEALSFRGEPGQIFFPPDVRFLFLTADHPLVDLVPGVWGLRKTSHGVVKRQLSLLEAEIIEALNEDRRFSRRQLLDFLVVGDFEGELKIEKLPGLQEALQSLLDEKLLIEF